MRENPYPVRAVPAAALLLLLVLAPLAFGRWTLEAFTYNKAVLLQAAALLLIAIAGPARIWKLLRGAVREPASLGAMLFGLAAIVSTLTAISPRTSLQGTPESFGGLGVVLAYLTVFFATRGMLASMAGIRALAVAASVATAGAAVYALLQVARLEPMAWDDASHVAGFVRPFGTFGTRSFSAATWQWRCRCCCT